MENELIEKILWHLKKIYIISCDTASLSPGMRVVVLDGHILVGLRGGTPAVLLPFLPARAPGREGAARVPVAVDIKTWVVSLNKLHLDGKGVSIVSLPVCLPFLSAHFEKLLFFGQNSWNPKKTTKSNFIEVAFDP